MDESKKKTVQFVAPHSVSLITSPPVPGYFLKKCYGDDDDDDDDDDVIECFHVTDGGRIGSLTKDTAAMLVSPTNPPGI